MSTRAAVEPPSTSTLTSPVRPRFTVTLSPATRAEVPPGVRIWPALFTVPPTSVTKPPSRLIRAPRFSTLPGIAGWPNWYLPARKSASLMCIAAEIRPPTSTRALAPNNTPLGLSSTTTPLALSWPRICDGSADSTRLSDTALADGCRKLTLAFWPTLKVCQLVIIRAVFCWMFMTLPAWLIAPEPAVIWPPVGSAPGAGPAASTTDSGLKVTARMKARRRTFGSLMLFIVFSVTGLATLRS